MRDLNPRVTESEFGIYEGKNGKIIAIICDFIGERKNASVLSFFLAKIWQSPFIGYYIITQNQHLTSVSARSLTKSDESEVCFSLDFALVSAQKGARLPL